MRFTRYAFSFDFNASQLTLPLTFIFSIDINEERKEKKHEKPRIMLTETTDEQKEHKQSLFGQVKFCRRLFEAHLFSSAAITTLLMR
jgi:hypothetical protein